MNCSKAYIIQSW